MPTHFYHVYAGAPDWRRVAFEHFSDLKAAAFEGDVRVGVVGSLPERARAADWLRKQWPDAAVVAEADHGYEQVTLGALHDYARSASPATPVFYAHAKGSVTVNAEQDLWRRCMAYYTIYHWEHCTALLDDNDAVGVHWTTPAELRRHNIPVIPSDLPPHFGGNYWWATAGYLAELASPGSYRKTGDRYDAEWWVGSGNPRVYDFGGGLAYHPHR